MARKLWMGAFAMGVCLWAVPGASAAGNSQDAAAKSGPKYHNLRWNEDFSYLDGDPDSYESDFFDPFKYIHLDPDWTLSLGGEFRFRFESEHNKAFGAVEPGHDAFHLYRYMLHADFQYQDTFRIFAQGVATFDEERDRALRAIDENRWDLQQLFFDLKVLGADLPLTLRVGRQDLQYGNQRLVSPLDWANVRRRFDGVKLFAQGDTWDVDMWYVKPVLVQREQNDTYDEDFDFYGIYATYKGIPDHGLDTYFLAIDDSGNRMNPNGRRGDVSRYTLGTRFWGRSGPYDYESEVAGQWGHWAGDTIQAWSVTINGGYTSPDCPYKSRIGAGFDWASGDDNPRDGVVGTFDQMFPLGHQYFGFLDLVGRQNITAFNVNLSAWPVENKVQTVAAFHTFWMSDRADALYDSGGAAVRRDVTGNSGRELGHELDLTMLWKLDVHSAMLLGYSHFWDSDFIQHTGRSENADLVYVQYSYKF
jgi:hypothetical protein